MDYRAERTRNAQKQAPQGKRSICLAYSIVDCDKDSRREEARQHEEEIAKQRTLHDKKSDGICQATDTNKKCTQARKALKSRGVDLGRADPTSSSSSCHSKAPLIE